MNQSTLYDDLITNFMCAWWLCRWCDYRVNHHYDDSDYDGEEDEDDEDEEVDYDDEECDDSNLQAYRRNQNSSKCIQGVQYS